MESILFWSLSGLTILFAFLVITSRNPVHSAVFLIGTLLFMAGLYILLDAEFLVGVQVIVYVGGITVLYLFVISLIVLKKISLESPVSRQWPAAVVAVVALLVEIVYFLVKGDEFFAAFHGPEDAVRDRPDPGHRPGPVRPVRAPLRDRHRGAAAGHRRGGPDEPEAGTPRVLRGVVRWRSTITLPSAPSFSPSG